MPDESKATRPRAAVAEGRLEVEPDAEHSVEVPAEDAAEQARPVERDGEPVRSVDVPLDADPADAAEQAREVDLDEDEYR